MVSAKKDETETVYWQRQNDIDENQLVEKGERPEVVGLYCQSCCYRYPKECTFINILHPYDRFAENCPDFVPKDFYKAKPRASCWKKRLVLDPDYKPLPDGESWHPHYWWLVCDSDLYWKVMTKEKAYEFIEKSGQMRKGVR